MIREVLTSKGVQAITSDKWHVVHSRFTAGNGRKAFVRAVFSEHTDRVECLKAAKALRVKLTSDNPDVPEAEQDEVFVRRPHYKSLERARHRKAKRE
jgi:hypothetical protein